jgi:hypothetical protein
MNEKKKMHVDTSTSLCVQDELSVIDKQRGRKVKDTMDAVNQYRVSEWDESTPFLLLSFLLFFYPS